MFGEFHLIPTALYRFLRFTLKGVKLIELAKGIENPSLSSEFLVRSSLGKSTQNREPDTHTC